MSFNSFNVGVNKNTLSTKTLKQYFTLQNTLNEDNANISEITSENLKSTKNVQLNEKIFNLKYSPLNPNILAACDENGNISIIDVNTEPKKQNSYQNNNDVGHIKPIFNQKIHSNAVFGLDWSHQTLLTSSADLKSKIVNLSSDRLGVVETELIGHTKRIKCVSHSAFDENLIATCGGDSIIFIWDKRVPNFRYCGSKVCRCSEDVNHIHPVGGYRNIYKDLNIKKKFSQSDVNILNTEVPNTFTACDFLNDELLISIEANNDDMKFWDKRNMLNTELDYIFIDGKFTKKQLSAFDKKNYYAAINQYTYLYTNYSQFKERNRLSSRYNTNNNQLFDKKRSSTGAGGNKRNSCNGNNTLDRYYSIKIDYENNKDIERELTINPAFHDTDLEEEKYYKNKINEIKQKRSKKGLTSLSINRSERKILINSMSNTQFIYDSLFMDERKPLELKGHESTYYVKSVLSPDGNYVVSGSNEPVVLIWSLKTQKCMRLEGYHSNAVNAVDWSTNRRNFIASGCDNGVIMIWDNYIVPRERY